MPPSAPREAAPAAPPTAPAPGRDRGEARFALAVLAAYLVAAGAAAAVHEPWRDETQAWLVARDAAGPAGLLENLRYEGHPPLWYALLWPLTRAGGPGLLQPLGVAIGAAAAWLFARRAPFPRLARALLPLGSLAVWEWGAVARGYGLGVLLLFAAAELATRRERRPLLLGLALALAALTSLHAALVAAGLLAALVVERLAPWREGGAAAGPFWAGAALAAAGIGASALAVAPPADSGVAAIWGARSLADRLGKALAAPVHGLATLPELGLVRGRPALEVAAAALAAAVAAALAAAGGLALARRRAAWIAAALPCAALLAVFYLRYYGGERHAGFLLVALLAALWAAPSFPARPPARGRLGRAQALGERRLGAALAAAAAFQVLVAAGMAADDARGVYSAARATAELVRGEGLEGLPLVADPDASAAGVVAFLGAPRAFYENVARWGSFAVWDRRHDPSRPGAARAADAAVFARARALAGPRGALVILDREADPRAAAGARLAGARRADVRREESFWVYLVPGR